MELFLILILILLNGVFAMSEIALVASRKIRLEAAAKAGKSGASAALDLFLSPTRFISSVQIGMTLIGLLTGIYSGENLTHALENWLMQYESIRPVAEGLSIAIVVLIITYCSLVLGELVPKRIGLSNPEGISRRLAPLMKLISRLASPFVWILTHTSNGILRLLNIKPKQNSITEEEIKAIIREGTKGGEIQAIERDIVERVFVLGDRKIVSLMTRRADLVFLDASKSFDNIVQTIRSELHSIYPVHEGDKDKIIGVASLKELFSSMATGNFNLRNHVRPANFLNENTSAYKGLDKFKTSKMNYALVTNEYGLVLGIVTMHDILNALVGDLYEENKTEQQIQKRKDGTWLIDGGYPMIEFQMFFGLKYDLEIETVNTMAGLVLQKLNHIPLVGEKIRWNGFEFEVIDMDSIRIDKILVKKIE